MAAATSLAQRFGAASLRGRLRYYYATAYGVAKAGSASAAPCVGAKASSLSGCEVRAYRLRYKYMNKCIYTHIDVYIDIYMYIDSYVYVCLSVCMYVCRYVCTYV